ncbi:hypothetical protein D3C77_789740 [compost metagenome]
MFQINMTQSMRGGGQCRDWQTGAQALTGIAQYHRQHHALALRDGGGQLAIGLQR